MEANLPTSYDLRKQISVQFFELSKTGLIIDYKLNGVDHTIELDQHQACRLLKSAGLIQSVEKNGRGVVNVSYEAEYNSSDNNGNHRQQCTMVYCTFQQFVLDTTFSQHDALTCAIYFQRNRQERDLVKQIVSEAKESFAKKLAAI